MDVSEVLADLLAEQQTLDDIVGGLDAIQWQLPTPSPGWTVADQIGNITSFSLQPGEISHDCEAVRCLL